MIIFGIDVGFRAPGFAVVDVTPESVPGKVLLAESFVPKIPAELAKERKIESSAHLVKSVCERIISIHQQFLPEVVVLELPTGGSKSYQAGKGMMLASACAISTFHSMQVLQSVPPFQVKHISPVDNKKGSIGKNWKDQPDQSKWNVFEAVNSIWHGQVDWPRKKLKSRAFELKDGDCWAMADALSCVATFLRDIGYLPKI